MHRIVAILVIFCFARGGAAEQPVGLDLATIAGAGNLTNGEMTDEVRQQIAIMQELGMRRCRVNLYPGRYLERIGAWDKPRAQAFDEVMSALHAANIEPMVLLEYYTDYHDKEGLGTEEQWFAIGQTIATRYRPGGTWAQENSAGDTFGVRLFTAMNEPEPGEFRLGGKLGPEPYVAALRGFGRGVKSIDPRLEVAPGGFMAANAWDDWTLRGLGPALAPLWNDGTLDGIDLHTYYDVEWAPMEGGYGNSAMHNFLMVKRASGITADIQFYSTEWNYKFRTCSREQAAAGVLTGFWDHVGAVGNDGRTLRSGIAFAWNVFNPMDKDTQFGMAASREPWTPSPRGAMLQRVLALTADLRLVVADPLGSGLYALTGEKATMWVWQNRAGWTDRPGTSLTLHGVPAAARTVTIHGADGVVRTVPVSGSSLTIADLPTEATLMFVADAAATVAPSALLPPDAWQIRPGLRQAEEDVDRLRGTILLQDTFADAKVDGWKLEPSSRVDTTYAVTSDLIVGEVGRCLHLTYAFTKEGDKVQPDLWRLTSTTFAQALKDAPEKGLRIAFNARCTRPGRSVRLMIRDRDDETFITEPIRLTPAWTTVVFALDDLKHWGGNPGNGRIDWPLRNVSLELLHWGGATNPTPEMAWIGDLRVLAAAEQ